jgi:hypothetical protein
MEGFDHIGANDLLKKWTTQQFAPGDLSQFFVSSSYARISGQGMRIYTWTGAAGGGSTFIARSIVNRQTLVVGTAFQIENYSAGNAGPAPVLSLVDNGTHQLDIRFDNNSRPYVTRNGTTLFTSNVALAINAWYYLELKGTINTTNGYAELRINGIPVGTFSGNTSGSGNNFANQIRVGIVSSNQSYNYRVWYDDIYALEADSNSGLVDFQGDCRVQTLMPSAPGTTTNMNRGGAQPANWMSVNEIPPDTATTVFGNTAGQYDTYDYPPLVPATNRVLAVAQSFVWQRDDAGFRTATARVRSAGNEADFTPTVIPLTNTYTVLQQVQETNPITGAAWAVNEVSNFEVGPKVAT